MDISKFIPFGHKNGISRAHLMYLTKESDRKNRENIEISQELILNMQDGNGYFRPKPEEVELVRRYYFQERSRALAILKRLSKCKRWLRANQEPEQLRLDEVV